MRILVAEDDPVTRRLLQAVLAGQGHTVLEARDGHEAWGVWQLAAPRVVISDWMMPVVDGLELCRRIRATPSAFYTYVILQTVRTGKASFLDAMTAGADDFVSKPVALDELTARLEVAARILNLRHALGSLQGLLSVCSYCKRIREANGQWGPIERYLEARSNAEFSHGFCPECFEKHVRPQLER